MCNKQYLSCFSCSQARCLREQWTWTSAQMSLTLSPRPARRTPCASSRQTRSTSSEERIKRSSMGELSGCGCYWLGQGSDVHAQMSETLLCVCFRWSEQLVVYPRTNKQNQKKKRKVEPATSQVNLFYITQKGCVSLLVNIHLHLLFPLHYFYILFNSIYCTFICSSPGARPSQGSIDWLWYPWGREGSRLQLHNLAGGAEPEGGWGSCSLGHCWLAPRITTALHR